MAKVATAERTASVGESGGALSAALNGVYTIWYRDLVRATRDRNRLVGSLAAPIFFLFVFGSGLSPIVGRLGGELSGPDYVQFMFPGMVGMAVLFTAIFSAVSIVWDREFGFLKEVLVAPVPRWAVAVGKALGGSTVASAQGMLMLIFAPLVQVSLTLVTLVALIPTVFVTAFGLSSFGLLIAARMKTMEGFHVIMNLLILPMFFLSGALFPLVNLPAWLDVLSRLNPVSYGVDAIRQVVLAEAGFSEQVRTQLSPRLFGQTMSPLADLALLAGFSVIMLALAVRAFSAQE